MGEKDTLTVVTKGLEWLVKASDDSTLAGGEAASDIEMKRQIKEALKLNGVDILDEVRKNQLKL